MASELPSQLRALEELSRIHPNRVLRLRGELPVAGSDDWEPFEVLIFRGFSSSISHPTGFDPDHPVLPEQARVATAELLEGPLQPGAERRLAGPAPLQTFLTAICWSAA